MISELLSSKEKNEIFSLEFSKEKRLELFTLTSEEISDTKSMRKEYIKLGFSLQLLFLKNLGRTIPLTAKYIPIEILEYIGEQLDVKDICLEKYFNADITRRRNFQDICKNLEFSKFKMSSEFFKIATELSSKISSNKYLVSEFLLKLKDLKIISPGLSTIEEILIKAIKKSNEDIYKIILIQLKDKSKLDLLLNVDDTGVSEFSKLKNNEINNSSSGAKQLLDNIKYINNLDCNCDLSFMSEEKYRYFYYEIQKSHRFRIQRFSSENKRYAYLAMFVYFRRKTFIDMVIEVTSNYAHKVMKRSKNKTQKHNKSNYKTYKSNSEKLIHVIENIIEIEDFENFIKYKSSLIELKEELDSQKNELEDIDFLLKTHYSFNYTNKLLENIEFESHSKPELIQFLKSFKNYKNKKKIDMEISFFSKYWQKNIKKYEFSKKVIEIAMLYSIRDNIRSGDLFVRESKKYNSYDSYLLDSVEYKGCEEATIFLNKLKKAFIKPIPFEFNNNYEKEERNLLSDKIYSCFPKISMTEMIYEVNSWTDFLDNFKENTPEKKSNRQKNIVATLLANGHNIGFSKMAISSSINEGILRRTNEYYFNNNTLFKAQKTLVNYQHSLNISKNWGSGNSSSSDGMRVSITSKSIYADYNSHYNNRGGAIYRHINDQFAPYYVQMLEGRDSNHVLDGLLYHGTDLEILNHSTDTTGYTEQMFALTYLLGFNFKPRIKNSDKQQLYYFENLELGDIKFKKINENLITDNFYEIMRLVESIRCGKVKASLILQKLSSYARDNSIAKGLKELGRILKTMYLLKFFTDSELRKEVQKILNKGEFINSVGRILHFGKNGRINEATIEEQLEKASSLNILLGVLVTWNSRYLEKIYKIIKNEDWFNEDNFKRVSPLGTQHINFLGKYILEEEIITTKDGLRDFKI